MNSVIVKGYSFSLPVINCLKIRGGRGRGERARVHVCVCECVRARAHKVCEYVCVRVYVCERERGARGIINSLTVLVHFLVPRSRTD